MTKARISTIIKVEGMGVKRCNDYKENGHPE